MKTNLIQSYLNNVTTLQQYNSDNAKKNFDVNKELANRTFIKPLPSNGYLVRNNIFDYPAELFKDVRYRMRAFSHSIRGNANDAELGSLNDAGMKLGGLAIAAYLFTRKQTPLTKLMEFVGFCSFFGAMQIWPRLALQLPAYLIHGFDIRQKYRDNYDTKKPVFLDHQFIPWDLYTDEEINKIGDRMRVPKDMKNRRDFVQEKMRKIALQNNTLWMLTSGFATPIMSALICNALEKPLLEFQDVRRERKAEALLNNLGKEAAKCDYSRNTTQLNKIIDENMGKNITPSVFDSIVANISEGVDSVTAKGIAKDLRRMLSSNSFDISKNVLNSVSHVILNDFESSGVSKDILSKVVPSSEEFVHELARKGLLDEEGIRVGISDFEQYRKVIASLVNDKFLNSDIPQEAKNKLRFKASYKYLIHRPEITKSLQAEPSLKLTDDLAQRLKKISGVLNEFKSHMEVLDRYVYLKAAMAPETNLANSWNKIISDKLLKTLGITQKEITATRYDERLVGDLLREKFETITSDKNMYQKVISELQEDLLSLEEKTGYANIDVNVKRAETDNYYKKSVDSVFEATSEPLKKLGMHSTLQRLFGYETNDKSSLRNIQLSYVIDRVKGVKGAIYRMVSALDMFRRISTLENVGVVSGENVPREVKEEIVELCKQMMIGGHSSDYTVKGYMRRNPDLNSESSKDLSDIRVEGGKVKNKYFGTRAQNMLAENIQDRDFYERFMKLMYGESLHPDTISSLKDTLLSDNLEAWRKNILRIYGGAEYFMKVNHKVAGQDASNATSNERFLQLGNALDDMFTKLFRSSYNSHRWLKFFSIFGAGLLGVTVLMQFFFGHMHSDKYEDKADVK